jgi:hypothetical protein
MTNYFASFRIVGEVVEMLQCEGPDARLLIDISAEAPKEDADAPNFVWKSTFSILDPDLIREFREKVGAGDVISAEGRFWQESYVPQGGVHVDTTFLLQSFSVVRKCAVPPLGFNPFWDLQPGRIVN